MGGEKRRRPPMARLRALRLGRHDDARAGLAGESRGIRWAAGRWRARRQRLSHGPRRRSDGAALTRAVGLRVADYGTGETTLARGLWSSVPDNSLVIFDRNFLIKHELVHFEMSGNKHWLSRSKVNTRWASVKRLGPNDELVELETQEPGIPTWQLRAIHYKRKGFPRATLLTSLLDPS